MRNRKLYIIIFVALSSHCIHHHMQLWYNYIITKEGLYFNALFVMNLSFSLAKLVTAVAACIAWSNFGSASRLLNGWASKLSDGWVLELSVGRALKLSISWASELSVGWALKLFNGWASELSKRLAGSVELKVFGANELEPLK